MFGGGGQVQGASRAQSPQCYSGVCISLCGGEAVPSNGFCIVLRNIFTILENDAQVVLSDCMPLFRCKAVESHSLRIVL